MGKKTRPFMKCKNPDQCTLVIALRNQVKQLTKVVKIQTRMHKVIFKCEPPAMPNYSLN